MDDIKDKILQQEAANALKKLQSGKTLTARESTLLQDQAGKKTGTRLERFTSMTQCANSLGVPVSEVRRCKLSGESGAFNYHRIEGEKVREWLANNSGANSAEESTDWKERKAKADALYREMQLAKVKETLVDKQVVQQETDRLMSQFFSIVERYVDRVEFSAITEECRAAAISD